MKSKLKMLGWLKKLVWPLSALFAVLMFFFRGRPTDKGALQRAQAEATAAKVDVVNANSALEKEKIKHETEQALADAAALTDDDIIADALGEYRTGGPRGNPGGTGPEGADPDG